MKKLVLILTVILLALNFSFANNDKPKDDIIVKRADGIEIIKLNTSTNRNDESDALHCKVKCADGTTYSCWFCNCSELPSCGGGAQQQ